MSDSRSMLEKLPIEIHNMYLAPFLSKYDLCKVRCLSSSMYSLYSGPYLAKKLIHFVFTSNYQAAESLLKDSPEIMLQHQVITYPDDDRREISAVKLACYLLGVYMLNLFIKIIDDATENIKYKFYRQVCDQQNYIDLTPLFNFYNSNITDMEKLALMQRQLVPYHMLKELCRTGVIYNEETTFENISEKPISGILKVYDKRKNNIVVVPPYQTQTKQDDIKPISRAYHIGHASLKIYDDEYLYPFDRTKTLTEKIYQARLVYVLNFKEKAKIGLEFMLNNTLKKFKTG